MDELNLKLIIGVPVSPTMRMGKPYTPRQGSIERPCGKCGTVAWMGPNQQALAAETGYPFWCMMCAALYVRSVRASGKQCEPVVKLLSGGKDEE